MKKFVSALILATAVSFSGCGNSTDFASAASLPVVVDPAVPVPVPDPVPAPPVAVDGFFVDAVAGSDTTGNFTGGLPFQTIQMAVNVAPDGATITVRPGSYPEQINLQNNQTLQGEAGGVRPQLTGPIFLGDGNTVDFLAISGTPGNDDAIDGSGQDSGTVTNCDIRDITGISAGFDAPSATGTWNISNNTFDNIEVLGIALASDTGDNLTATINNNVITNMGEGAIGFTAGQDAVMNVQIQGNTMTGTINPGATFQVFSGDTSTFCADITGNTNDDTYQFGLIAVDTSVVNVEEFTQLTTLNSGGAVVDFVGGSRPVTDVVDGTCGF